MDRDEEHALEIRLAAAAAGAMALLVPFAILAAMVAGQVGWLHRADEELSTSLHAWAAGHPGWVLFMRVWCVVFDPWVWRVAALVLAVWLVRRGARRLAWWVGITMAAGGLLGVLLKLLFERARPSWLDPVASAVGYSFPSGHALNNALGAAVFLVVLWPVLRRRPGLRRGLLVALIGIAVLTGAFRVGIGVHWASDVVGGWLLGTGVVATTAAAFVARRRGARELAEIDA